MKVECPNCKMVSVVEEDQLVTAQTALQMLCPSCDFPIKLKMQATIGRHDTRHRLENQSLAGDSPDVDSREADFQIPPSSLALKTKILRGLVTPPPIPHIILEVREILADANSSLNDLAKVIAADPAIEPKVLALANSTYYAISDMMSSIQHISVLLGQKILGQLITLSASSSMLNIKLNGYNISSDQMWMHSLACALGAKRIAAKHQPDLVEDALVAGLLHDAGKIILDPHIVEQQNEFEVLCRQEHQPHFEAEKNILGFDHAEIMSRACRLWRFPETQVAAIRYHHTPQFSEKNELAYIIHLADILAKSTGFSAGEDETIDEFAVPDILQFLNIQPANLDAMAAAMMDDVQKLEAEIPET